MKVTEEDRAAARSIEWVQTTIDDHEAIAEAFATHRQSAERRALERAAEECDTRNSSAKAWKAHTAKGEPDWYRFDGAEQESANIAQAIRALGDE